MDTELDLENYPRIVQEALREYAKTPYYYGDIQRILVFDTEGDHYVLLSVGRQNGRRVHFCLIHLDLIDGKVWVQCDGTEYSITRELEAAGIPKDRIVLAFHEPSARQYTGYAIS